MKHLPDTEKSIKPLAGRQPAAVSIMKSNFSGKSLSPPVQRKPNETGLPDELKVGVESLSGYSMDDVNVHYNSSKPAQLNAHAYAQGTDIHVSPGQEKHLPHEAWHVVQQKQGRVKPTIQTKDNIEINDDDGLEKEADVMSEKALNMPSMITQKKTKYSVKSTLQRKTNDSRVIQRMPTSLSIKTEYGHPSTEDGKQNGYKNVLRAIDDFHAVRGAMVPGHTPVEVATSFEVLLKEYDKVYNLVNTYLNGKKKMSSSAKNRKNFFKELKDQITREKEQAQFARQILSNALIQNTITLQANDQTETKGGALNKVYKHAEGYFKENHENLPTRAELEVLSAEYSAISSRKQDWIEKGRALEREDKTYKGEPVIESREEIDRQKVDLIGQENELAPAISAMETVVNTSEAAGINPLDSHTASRDVASARLDLLLGGGIIAQAEFALQTNGEHTKQGVLMNEAQGDRIGDLGNSDNIVSSNKQKGAGKLYIKDPEFMRQLSRLQLLDTLALQVDRNLGNFFVQLDGNGNVVKLTGIDNDMSFGSKQEIDVKEMEYPGLSKYVDKEMANSILALDEKVLALTLSGLVSAGEMDALMARLRKLKAHLNKLKSNNKLLEPNQWNDAIVKKLSTENKSYFASIYNKAGKI